MPYLSNDYGAIQVTDIGGPQYASPNYEETIRQSHAAASVARAQKLAAEAKEAQQAVTGNPAAANTIPKPKTAQPEAAAIPDAPGLSVTYGGNPASRGYTPNWDMWTDNPGDSYIDKLMQDGVPRFADGGMVDATHPLYQKYLTAMHRAGMLNQAQAPEAIIPRMAQYEAQQRMSLAQQTVNGGTQGYAAGGAVDVGGSMVTGPGTGKSDSIPAIIDGAHPAALSTGEFVFPKQAVDFYGTKVLDAMILKAKQALKLKG